jgi:hypothetical protein
MSKEYVSKDEIEKERTPSELWDWLIQKVEQICSTEEGLRAFRLQKGLLKKLPEEIAPLAIFGKHNFRDTDQVLLKPVIGSQNYDAEIIDKRTEPPDICYIEITQAHEGENDYWRRCELLKKGMVFTNTPVIKMGNRRNREVSILPEATPVEEVVKNELKRIADAAKRKAGKVYPANTSLVIFFDDTALSHERLKVLNCPTIDDFVKNNLMKLSLSFSHLYLVGEANEVFQEYQIKRRG